MHARTLGKKGRTNNKLSSHTLHSNRLNDHSSATFLIKRPINQQYSVTYSSLAPTDSSLLVFLAQKSALERVRRIE